MTNAETARTDALTLVGASKNFGHVQALHEADLRVSAGRVHAIVGDNGAGKSTMLKILSGLHKPDGGELRVAGGPVSFDSPAEARDHGIATVYQDLALVECLDVATNLHLGDIPKKRFFVDRKRMERDAERVLADLNVRVGSVRTPVGMLSGGQRQIIAISRAVRLEESKIVLLDEPTAALGIQERGHVGGIVERLKAKGKAVIIICHDLDFVFTYCDEITVMRLGRTVAHLDAAATDRDEVIGYITGARQGSTA
ncbi:ATP-binding cassette domain-containing protein [Actinomadura nitritigenes]|uniref:ATP-binding cassette domain-containing protein n=1 Tax=Actinomadura nitritigenes TaxID=134602 RepID=UPI003D8C81FF